MLVKAFIVDNCHRRQGEGFEFHTPILPSMGSNIHLATLYTVVSHPTAVLRRSYNGGTFTHNELDSYEVNVQEV